MKILCFVGEEDDDTRHVLAHQLANPPEDQTVVFDGTDAANIERDDDDNATIYTVGKEFYLTLTKVDMLNIANLLTRKEIFDALFHDWIVNEVRESGGIDTVMASLQVHVIDQLKDEGWI